MLSNGQRSVDLIHYVYTQLMEFCFEDSYNEVRLKVCSDIGKYGAWELWYDGVFRTFDDTMYSEEEVETKPKW